MDLMQPSGKSNCSRLVLQMELFVDDLVECHGDVRVRAMMVLCHWRGNLTVALAFIAIL